MLVCGASSSANRLGCCGSRCCTSTNARPLSGGVWRINVVNACKPPADAPMPTTCMCVCCWLVWLVIAAPGPNSRRAFRPRTCSTALPGFLLLLHKNGVTHCSTSRLATTCGDRLTLRGFPSQNEQNIPASNSLPRAASLETDPFTLSSNPSAARCEASSGLPHVLHVFCRPDEIIHSTLYGSNL